MQPSVAILKSFIEPAALAQQLASHYGLTNARTMLIKTTIRDVYRVTSDAGMHVAILYPAQRTPQMIDEEIAITDHLHQHGLPVVPPIAALDSRRHVTLTLPEGPRQLIVLPYVDAAMTRSPSPDTVRHYGEVVARMHLATDGLTIALERPVYDVQRLVLDAMQHIRAALTDRPAIVAELDAIAAAVAPRLAALEHSAPAFGFVHADIAPSNALIAADGSLTLIDFDLCGLGWRVMDIASYLNEIEYWRMGPMEGVFLEGYTSIRPLSEADMALLPLFRVATALHILHHAAAHVNIWSSAMYLADAFMRPGIEGMKRQLALL